IGHFLAIHGKDPIYYAFVYLLSNSGFVNASGYVFTSVFVSYFLILGSTVRAARLLGICADKIFLAILILLYFDPLFSNSAHLLRQFLAGAVVLFALSRSTQDSKETWLLTIAASLIHSSATVFILVLLVRRFLGGRKLRNTILRLCCVIVALFMLRFAPGPITMVSSALGLDFISYAISRLSQESFFELQPLSAGSLVYVIILAAASFLSTFRLSAEKAHLSSPDRFTEPTLLISMTIIFSHFIGFDEISVRYLIYLYILSGVIMAIFLSRFCGPVMLVSMALSPCIPIIFILELNTGAWTYASGWQLAFGSFYSFIE
ncbi:MAG: EpsG family protein, partial [Verrucomicrobiota bacterium]|nr:EpsG family protein [Verrucomicrobiota bacterium]